VRSLSRSRPWTFNQRLGRTWPLNAWPLYTLSRRRGRSAIRFQVFFLKRHLFFGEALYRAKAMGTHSPDA